MAKTENVIYAPPNNRLPYLVVTVAPEGVSALPARSRVEARAMTAKAARRTLRQENPNRVSIGTG